MEVPGQNNNNVLYSSCSLLLCLPQALCACSADRLPEGPPGSEPPVVRTAVCRREPIGVYVIKHEHASLPPASRGFHLGWMQQLLAGCVAAWLSSVAQRGKTGQKRVSKETQ